MYKIILGLLLLILISCEKEPTCETLIADTYSNYHGYWDYCRYGSDEINPDLVYIYSDTLNSCESNYYNGMDTVYYRALNCPRNGTMSYAIQIVVR
jgi:hypothetical protein